MYWLWKRRSGTIQRNKIWVSFRHTRSAERTQ